MKKIFSFFCVVIILLLVIAIVILLYLLIQNSSGDITTKQNVIGLSIALLEGYIVIFTLAIGFFGFFGYQGLKNVVENQAQTAVEKFLKGDDESINKLAELLAPKLVPKVIAITNRTKTAENTDQSDVVSHIKFIHTQKENNTNNKEES